MFLCIEESLTDIKDFLHCCFTHPKSLSNSSVLYAVVPRRLMSSVPGGSGENFFYVVLCGGAFAGALAYKTVSTDHARFVDRVSEIDARPKSDWKPKAWPPKGKSYLWSG
uniref:Protein MGARP N-terminal domain-containing protein n=1 Tax=Cyprinus carpio TaxID=7962 RepID=A0A8C2GBP0_CYPCA